jgi:hypothetical protein
LDHGLVQLGDVSRRVDEKTFVSDYGFRLVLGHPGATVRRV